MSFFVTSPSRLGHTENFDASRLISTVPSFAREDRSKALNTASTHIFVCSAPSNRALVGRFDRVRLRLRLYRKDDTRAFEFEINNDARLTAIELSEDLSDFLLE